MYCLGAKTICNGGGENKHFIFESKQLLHSRFYFDNPQGYFQDFIVQDQFLFGWVQHGPTGI